MRLHDVALVFASLVSLVALNGCAAEPETEGQGSTESNQVSEGRKRAAASKTTTEGTSGGTTGTTTGTTTSSSGGTTGTTTSSSGGTDSTDAWVDLIAAAAAAAAKNQGSSGGSNGTPQATDNGGNGGNGGLPVLVTWNGVDGTEASFDVVLKNGHIIGPCASVDVLRAQFQSGQSDGLGYGFDGSCPSNNEQPAAGDIKSFRICSARNNDWANATCTESAPWNHTNAAVHINNH